MTDDAQTEKGGGKGSFKGALIGALAATLLAAGAGGGMAVMLASHISIKTDGKGKAAEPEKGKKKEAASGDMTFREADTVMVRLKPVMTNLRTPFKSWVRLEGALALKHAKGDNLEEIAAMARQDILAYLRTLSLKDLEGASNLAFLRDDLNERAKIRFKDKVREVMILSLVVE
jgi:flagellar FliL protein